MNKLFTYLQETKTELKKVIWPNKQETIRHTLIVIAVSLVIAAYIGALDYILLKLMSLIV